MEILSNVDVNLRVNRITDYNSYYLENRVYGIRNERPENFNYSIFLSHSHHDASLVKKIALLLKTLGVEVYVDWLDETMPSSTCDKTASKIKQKIKQNHKFIFLATNNSIESKWCNWEIGFCDANKYNDDDIAIFPVKDNNEWKGNEYLQLYPSIKKKEFSNELYIEYPDGKIILLTEWMKK